MQLDKFARVTNEVLQRIADGKHDAATMALSAALLEQNPECYTVWGHRREVLAVSSESADSTVQDAVQARLLHNLLLRLEAPSAYRAAALRPGAPHSRCSAYN